MNTTHINSYTRYNIGSNVESFVAGNYVYTNVVILDKYLHLSKYDLYTYLIGYTEVRNLCLFTHTCEKELQVGAAYKRLTSDEGILYSGVQVLSKFDINIGTMHAYLCDYTVCAQESDLIEALKPKATEVKEVKPATFTYASSFDIGMNEVTKTFRLHSSMSLRSLYDENTHADSVHVFHNTDTHTAYSFVGAKPIFWTKDEKANPKLPFQSDWSYSECLCIGLFGAYNYHASKESKPEVDTSAKHTPEVITDNSGRCRFKHASFKTGGAYYVGQKVEYLIVDNIRYCNVTIEAVKDKGTYEFSYDYWMAITDKGTVSNTDETKLGYHPTVIKENVSTTLSPLEDAQKVAADLQYLLTDTTVEAYAPEYEKRKVKIRVKDNATGFIVDYLDVDSLRSETVWHVIHMLMRTVTRAHTIGVNEGIWLAAERRRQDELTRFYQNAHGQEIQFLYNKRLKGEPL